MKVEFYRHSLGDAEKAAVAGVIDTLFLTTGPRAREFEQRFAAYQGAPHCIGLSSCTAGLYLTLKAWGIGPGDRVIVPAMTFVASANVVIHAGADVVFCDVDARTGLLDPAAAELGAASGGVKALMPVHLYGQLADIRSLRSLADRHGLRLLEDSAHCVEGERDGVRPGTLGDAAAFSFYATKNLACGEGGAVVTRSSELAEYLAVARLHGMSRSALTRHERYEHWDMDFPGYKANLSDIQAALLLPQLDRLDALWRRREEIAGRYAAAFSASGVEFPADVPGARHARHLFTIWAPDGRRDEFITALQADGIGCVVNYRPVHLTRYYRERYGCREGQFPAAERIGRRTISLPLYPLLTDAEVGYVIERVGAINARLAPDAAV
jgi:UDP-4-amino-4-deoxy-L-arabinose-oxoglutarate aminotransferase